MQMKVLVFDTETTGLPIGRNPSIRETKKWPHIVQLSCILFDTDTNEIIRSYDTVVKVPDNIKISEESISLHGISRDISNTQGFPVKDVLKEFNKMLIASDKVIGHNISFDKRVVMVESIRLYISQYFTIDGVRKPEYCTMKNNFLLIFWVCPDRYDPEAQIFKNLWKDNFWIQKALEINKKTKKNQ